MIYLFFFWIFPYFQRRDDDVPIFLTKTIREIREIFKQKEEERRIEAQQL